jgi:N-acylneuraminate cytidylyltransferase/CMP-N,N'-diacetyllegionaminic acid synthase
MMFRDKRCIAIIPARGGSKGLPGKNLKLMCGKPMIYWVIKAAKESGIFDAIVVSSDDDATLEYAEACGVFPHKRPGELATDSALVYKTVKLILDMDVNTYDYVQLIQPTSPLLTGKQIREAVEVLWTTGADKVVGVSQLNEWQSIAGSIKELFKKTLVARQQLQPKWYINGMIYAGTPCAMSRSDSCNRHIVPYYINKYQAVDVDNIMDFKEAECILKQRLS